MLDDVHECGAKCGAIDASAIEFHRTGGRERDLEGIAGGDHAHEAVAREDIGVALAFGPEFGVVPVKVERHAFPLGVLHDLGEEGGELGEVDVGREAHVTAPGSERSGDRARDVMNARRLFGAQRRAFVFER